MMTKVKKLLLAVFKENSLLWKAINAGYGKAKGLYRSATKNSIFVGEGELYMCSLENPKMILETIRLFSPKSVLDIGCGTGKSLDLFLENGVEAFGVEGSALAISKALNPDKMMQFNLNNELNLERKFDLAWSVEVAEHIHPKYVHHFLKTITNHADRVVITAAPPGQGGEGHFNEQPQSYWIQQFDQRGYAYDGDSSKVLRDTGEEFAKNVMVFSRK